MDTLILFIAIVLLLLTTAGGWGLTLMGLPGNWLIVAAAALYAWLGPTSGATQVTWTCALALLALATVGEIAELAVGVWGTRLAGGSRRAAIFSLIGSLGGAVLGASLGIPIPLIGPPLAALLGGAIGALVGAGCAEYSRGEASRQSFRVGGAAFLGRLLGTGVKTLIATIMAIIAVVALLV